MDSLRQAGIWKRSLQSAVPADHGWLVNESGIAVVCMKGKYFVKRIFTFKPADCTYIMNGFRCTIQDCTNFEVDEDEICLQENDDSEEDRF